MTPAARAAAIALAIAAGIGCASATRQPPRLSERFVQRPVAGEPVSQATFDVPAEPAEPAPPSTPRPAAIDVAVLPKQSVLPTLESQSAELARSLRAVRTGDAATHRAVAHEYLRLGVYDQAYDYFRRALAIDRRDAAAFDGLARTWRDWRLPEMGLGDAYRAVGLAPDSPIANNTLGTLLFALGDVAAATARFERVLVLDPDAGYARANLCRIATDANDAVREAKYCAT